MRYYLWDTDIAKLLGAFQTEEEALTLVRVLVARYGATYADEFALGIECGDRSPSTSLSGADLLSRAEAVPANYAASDRRVPERTTGGVRPRAIG